MAVSILEALQGAEYNLDKNRGIDRAQRVGLSQLHNAIILLEKGYSIWTEVEPLLEKYGDVENVPAFSLESNH